VRLQNGTRIDAGTGVSHLAMLTGLTPGKRYEYTVEGDSGALATATFRAAPVGASKVTFAVVGDFGSGTSQEAAVASLIDSWHPNFLLTVGDNAYPTGSSELLDRDIFRPYAAVMRESAWFPALGNHDVKANGGAPELEAFHSLGTERWYRFTWGNAAVVVLDSDISVAPGARRALARRSCFRFAARHHPPWEPPRRPISPDLRRYVVPLVRREGIQVVFVGHLHAYAPKSPARRSRVRGRRDRWSLAGQRRAHADDPACAYCRGLLRRAARGRRRSQGAPPLRGRRRRRARSLPSSLLVIVQRSDRTSRPYCVYA
jgi:hypothetical protein